jgi:hypothetical protein
MIPALHWAITSAGCEMMNNGAPTAGSLSLSLRMFGSAIFRPLFWWFIDKRISALGTSKTLDSPKSFPNVFSLGSIALGALAEAHPAEPSTRETR